MNSATGTAAPAGASMATSLTASGPAKQEPDGDDEIFALEAPGVPAAAQITPTSMQSDIICRRERATGTKFTRRVCRSRLEVEARAEADQDMWYQMRRQSY